MISVNALQGVSAVVNMPETGVWTVDVDLNLELLPIVPSGPALLTIGTNAMRGTIDPRATGRFGSKAKARVVGGKGGWDQPGPAVHLHNDAGVLSTAVYSTAAAAVGEIVVENTPPKRLGPDFVRMRGPASQVFAGVAWWVDILGVTHVGPRIPLPAPPTIEVLEWDATNKVAHIATDFLVIPGMVLVDPLRFGTVVVKDVQQTFSADGARAIAWCKTPDPVADAKAALVGQPPPGAGSQTVRAMAAIARHAIGASKMRTYPYRVVSMMPDGRVNLANPTLDSDAPKFLTLIDIWAGLPGYSAKLVVGTEVFVQFVEEQPRIVAFDPKAPIPLESKMDAVRIALGTLAAIPVAKATATQAQIAALTTAVGAIATYIAAVTAAAAANPSAYAAFATAIAAPGGTVASALGGLAAAISALVVPATSTKVFTD